MLTINTKVKKTSLSCTIYSILNAKHIWNDFLFVNKRSKYCFEINQITTQFIMKIHINFKAFKTKHTYVFQSIMFHICVCRLEVEHPWISCRHARDRPQRGLHTSLRSGIFGSGLLFGLSSRPPSKWSRDNSCDTNVWTRFYGCFDNIASG